LAVFYGQGFLNGGQGPRENALEQSKKTPMGRGVCSVFLPLIFNVGPFSRTKIKGTRQRQVNHFPSSDGKPMFFHLRFLILFHFFERNLGKSGKFFQILDTKHETFLESYKEKRGKKISHQRPAPRIRESVGDSFLGKKNSMLAQRKKIFIPCAFFWMGHFDSSAVVILVSLCFFFVKGPGVRGI